MSAYEWLRNIYKKIELAGTWAQEPLLLLIRLFWGVSFFDSGLGKLKNISGVSSFFGELGIPFPLLSGYLVGCFECIGGLLLILGLGTRVAAFVLAIIMSIAIVTTNHSGLANIAKQPEEILMHSAFSYWLVCLFLFGFGPGRISFDYLLEKLFFRKRDK